MVPAVPFALQPQLDAVAEADIALRELQELASMPDLALADFIPPGLAEMLTRRAASFPVDPNAFVLPILTVVSSIIGNRIRSQFKPGHIESLAIWGANVQPASAMKSPVFGVFLGPLNEWEGEFRKAAKAERQRWRRDRAAAATGETGPAAKDAIRQWEEDNPAPDPARTLSVNDATLERIAQYLQADNTTGLLQFADELMSWLSSMRRGKDAPDQRGNWLSSWSGGAMKISRVTREDTYVAHALISILGAIQPLAVLQLREQAMREGRTVRDGLWARMLLWRPRRLPYDYQAPGYCCREAILNFYKQLDRLAPHIAEDAMPALLSFSPEAIHLAGQAFNSWDEQSRKVDDSELGEWLGKLRGYAIRIAAILHCIERAAMDLPLGNTIAVETVARSLLLCNHLIAQYRLASVELDIDTDITEADPLVLKLIARLATWRKDNPGKDAISLSDIGLMGIPRRRSPAGEVAQWLDLTLNHHPQIGTVVVGPTGGLVLQLNT